MHFKIVVLFCALNFFTATRSFGLSEFLIYDLVDLFVTRNVNNRIPDEKDIDQFLNNVGITNDAQIIVLKQNLYDDTTMSEFLISLAYSDKESFKWMCSGFSTYEVELFVKIFKKYDGNRARNGFLTQGEFNELIANGLNLNEDYKRKILIEFKDEKPIHVLRYMAALVKNKPTGKGLDEAQINKCQALYYNRPNQYLDAPERQQLFETLNIVPAEHFDLLNFKQYYSAARELKMFLVLWSEYNDKVDNSPASVPWLSTDEVRQHMSNFTLYDNDHDGLLNLTEFKKLARDNFPDLDAIDLFDTFNPESRSMCAATFLKMELLKGIPRSKIYKLKKNLKKMLDRVK